MLPTDDTRLNPAPNLSCTRILQGIGSWREGTSAKDDEDEAGSRCEDVAEGDEIRIAADETCSSDETETAE